MTTPTHSHKPWTDKGGHVSVSWPRAAHNHLGEAFRTAVAKLLTTHELQPML